MENRAYYSSAKFINGNLMKKICIIGASGMLGYATTKVFQSKNWSVTTLTRNELDIGKDGIEKLAPYIEDVDLIVNCAGVIKPRIAELTIEEVLKVNSIFPHNLAKVSNRFNLKTIHITTDCIYSGLKGNYDELSPIDAQDVYGLSKAAGDTSSVMTLRTSIIGEEPVGQSRSLIEWVKKQNGAKINGFTNHQWNGVTTWYLATLLEEIVEKNLYQKGVFHIHSPKSVSKFQLVSEIAKVYGINAEIKPTEASEFCDRTLSSIYPLTKDLAKLSIPEQLLSARSFFQSVENK
jgi:dTDP-4-dehydrorhamnose reductase